MDRADLGAAVAGELRVGDRPDGDDQHPGDEPVQPGTQDEQRRRDEGDDRRVESPLSRVHDRPGGLPEDVVSVCGRAERRRKLGSDDQDRRGRHEPEQQGLREQVREHPARSRPTATRMTPTMSASSAASLM